MKSLFRPESNLTRRFFDSPIDSLFEDFFKGLPVSSETFKSVAQFSPKINISETENEYKVSAELPGLEEKDFEVTIEDNLLRLKGEKKFSTEEKNENYHRVETSFGSFERLIRLPDGVDASKAKAQFKNGVLNLSIAKNKELSKVHKLKIES